MYKYLHNLSSIVLETLEKTLQIYANLSLIMLIYAFFPAKLVPLHLIGLKLKKHIQNNMFYENNEHGHAIYYLVTPTA